VISAIAATGVFRAYIAKFWSGRLGECPFGITHLDVIQPVSTQVCPSHIGKAQIRSN
jgi:hypothetical protein